VIDKGRVFIVMQGVQEIQVGEILLREKHLHPLQLLVVQPLEGWLHSEHLAGLPHQAQAFQASQVVPVQVPASYFEPSSETSSPSEPSFPLNELGVLPY